MWCVVGFLHEPETVLLAIRRVPYPVNEQISDIQRGQSITIPLIFGRWVVGEIDGAVTVAQGYSSQIPENEHESKLLVVHVPTPINQTSPAAHSGIPSCDNAFLSLRAGVRI